MPAASPPDQIRRMLSGYWVSQAIYVAAKLGLADLVKGGPRSVDDLANATGTHAPSLYRLLRALASVGVFAEEHDRRFALTPLAECLRSNAPDSQRSLAVMMGEEHFGCYGRLLDAVRSGEIVFDKIYEVPVFEFLSQHPEKGRTFDEAMVGVHGEETAAMLAAYDFSNLGTLADVGGGNGSLLSAVLQKYPKLRGVLVDLANVAARAQTNFAAAGVTDRCQVLTGDFFESIPGGADAYLMRHIIHDWEDQKAIQILANVHRALAGRGKLLLVEGVVQAGNTPSFTKLLDLTMLLITGGRERTQDEYRRLLADAGFKLTRVVPTASEVSVIEAEPV
jgi:hypothetical protein